MNGWCLMKKGFSNALVKKDSSFGWLDKDYVFHKDFPSADAEREIKEFEYLTRSTFGLGRNHQDLIYVMYPLKEGFIIYHGVESCDLTCLLY